MVHDVQLFKRVKQACHDHAPGLLYNEREIIWKVYRQVKEEMGNAPSKWGWHKRPPKWLIEDVAYKVGDKMWRERDVETQRVVAEIHEQSDNLQKKIFGRL